MKIHNHNRKVWVAGGVIFFTFALVGSWILARAHADANRLWQQLSAEHEVQVVTSRVYPVGLRTWRARKLLIWPRNAGGASSADPMLEVERLSLTFCPRQAGERRRICSVVLHEPRVFVDIGGPSGGHLQWLSRRFEAPSEGPSSAAGLSQYVDEPLLPEIRIERGHFAVEDSSGRFPGLGAHLESLLLEVQAGRSRWHRQGDDLPARVRMEGRVVVEGWGPARLRLDHRDGSPRLVLSPASDHNLLPSGHGLPGIASDATLSIGQVSVSWPLAIQVHSLRLEQGAIGRPPADLVPASLWVDQATVELSADGAELRSSQVRAYGEANRGELSMRLTDLELAWPWRDASASGQVVVRPPAGGGQLALSWRVDRGADKTTFSGNFDQLPASLLSPYLDKLVGVTVQEGLLAGGATATISHRGGPWRLQTNLSFEGGAATLPSYLGGALSSVDLALNTEWVGSASLNEIELAPSEIQLGRLPLSVEGAWIDRGDARKTHGRIALELDEASQVLASLPPQLFPVLRSVGARGPMDLRLSWFLDSESPTEGWVELDGNFDDLAIGDPLWDDRWAALRDQAPRWRWSDEAGAARSFSSASWVSAQELDPLVLRAFLAAEDDRFFLHAGVDVRGLRAAMQYNLERGAWERGGSTISQQVAKNLILDHRRTLDRKIEEWAMTLLMEAELSKTRILELYLNMARMGPESWGLGEAAQYYYGRDASDLELAHAVQLAAILPGPALFGPALLDGDLPYDRRVKMGNILRNLRHAGHISVEEFTSARDSLGAVMVAPPPAPPQPTAASHR